MRKYLAALLLLLLLASVADAFYVGEVVYVYDPGRYVGYARIRAIQPNGNLVVDPWVNAPPGARNAWIIEPPSKCFEPTQKKL